MKKYVVAIAFFAVLLIGLPLNLGHRTDDRERLIITRTPSRTPVPTSGSTSTPTLVPTVLTGTPEPTEPVPTATEPPSSNDPYPDAPLCVDHDINTWHSLWDSSLGCHYDHQHGHDPIDTIFTSQVSQWDSTISYPWETPNENAVKHKGYFYLYLDTEAMTGNPCALFTNDPNGVGNVNCVTHALLQLHSVGTQTAMIGRFHSFRFVARVCDQATLTSCAIVEGGGHTDYGTLHCPYKNAHCPLASDPDPLPDDNGVLPEKVAFDQPPYRANPVIADINRILPSGIVSQFWVSIGPGANISGYYPDDPNSLAQFSWNSSDSWIFIDPSDVENPHFICEDGSCQFNHSSFNLFTVFLTIPQAPFNGFTDRHGHIVQGCTEVGVDCVPLTVEGDTLPDEIGFFNIDVKQNQRHETFQEFDICFNSLDQVISCLDPDARTSGWIRHN